jgi:hypothetical protein
LVNSNDVNKNNEKNKQFLLSSLKINNNNDSTNDNSKHNKTQKKCENEDWKVVDSQNEFFLYVGKPGVLAGHIADASSYFDRFYLNFEFIIYILSLLLLSLLLLFYLFIF